MHEIKIYGDIVHVSESAENNICLLDVQNMLKEAKGQPVLARLNGNGGDVDEGFSIYYELRRYAKENNVPVKTFAESRLASIYTVIFLAGDERELCTDLQPFVHMAYFDGKAKLDEKDEAYLQATNNRIAQHYADHTDLTFNEALALMEGETFIDTQEAKAMRFATSIENVLRPVALKRFNQTKNDDMNKNPKTANVLAKALAYIKSLGAVNKILFDATGTEIDFYELAEDEIAEVGAKARIDGKDAEGSYVMSDGATYVFVAGELTEIVAPVDNGANEEAVALQAQIDTLTEQLEAVTNKAVEVNTEVETLRIENKRMEAVINAYKNIKSADAPDDKKENKKDDKKEINSLDSAVQNLKTIKLK